MRTIDWKPFSDKHKDYIRAGMDCVMSVGEGAVRAAKTIANCIIACMYLETCEDKIHLASGSSLPNAKLNIGDCNGYGLEHLFAGRCHWGKYKSNEALYIKTKTGEKIVIFAGGGKADSYKKILGNSYGLWIATEINEHYDADDSRTSFIKVALARQLASKNRKILWDLNPSNPNHKIYKQYIDKYAKDGLAGGYNYGHFTIDDNLSISEERKDEIRSMYDPNSIWYKRDILGMRCVAEGLIYKDFAEHTERYLISEDDLREKYQLTHIIFGVDFGGNKSAHTFVCTGFTYGLRQVIVLKSVRIEADGRDGTITPDKLEQLFVNFVQECYNRFRKGGRTYCDSAEQTLIGGLRSACARAGVPTEIHDARKNPTNDRISLVTKLMATGKFKVLNKGCESVIKAFSEAVWNSKEGHEDERLDNFTSDIDTLDACEYSIEPHLNELKYMA